MMKTIAIQFVAVSLFALSACGVEEGATEQLGFQGTDDYCAAFTHQATRFTGNSSTFNWQAQTEVVDGTLWLANDLSAACVVATTREGNTVGAVMPQVECSAFWAEDICFYHDGVDLLAGDGYVGPHIHMEIDLINGTGYANGRDVAEYAWLAAGVGLSQHLSGSSLPNTLTLPDPTVPSVETLPADLDGNGCVDFADFLAFNSTMGQSGSNLPTDFNGDGTVDFADFLILSTDYGMCV